VKYTRSTVTSVRLSTALVKLAEGVRVVVGRRQEIGGRRRGEARGGIEKQHMTQ
jgi:hypothetical protein